jgi:hypothetical protein
MSTHQLLEEMAITSEGSRKPEGSHVSATARPKIEIGTQ